jgi:dihydrofolate reductase
MAGKVVWHLTMSLDGFVAGPDDTMDWVFELMDTRSPVGDEVIETTGAILAGRRWYDLATSRWDGRAGIYGGEWTGPVFVLTHRPPDAKDDPGITFLSDGVEDAVATGLAAGEGRNLGLLGANTAQQVLDAGLLDEIVIHLAPVVLGDGIRFYGRPGAKQVKLERTLVAESGQLTDLRFRVVK